MGSTNGVTRGQLRPHFSGRSPPFLLAALCVGLGILGVSYWSLSNQYNDLEEQLKKALIRKDSIDNNLKLVQDQLNVREEEFIDVKRKMQKNEEQLTSLNNQIKTKEDRINELSAKIETLTKDNTKCSEELNQKSNDLGDVVSKLKEIQQQKDQSKDQNQELSHLKDENKRLEKEMETLRHQLFSTKNDSKSDTKPVIKGMENSVNDLNSLKVINNSIKTEEQIIKTEIKPEEESRNKGQQSVIAEPIKLNEVIPSNGLPEEDRREESLVEANEANNNEMADEFKSENKDAEDSKLVS